MSNIIVESVRGPQLIPIDDMLLKQRKIFLVGTVDDESVNALIKKLLYLESVDDTAPVHLFINSPGGSVSDGLALYDTISLMKAPVTAVVTGIAASMGSIIMLACDKERRLMLPNSRIMIHDASFGGKRDMSGLKPHEIQQELDQLTQVNDRLVSILAKRCGRTVREVAKVTKSDSYFDAPAAIKFGLASSIIDSDTLSSLIKEGV